MTSTMPGQLDTIDARYEFRIWSNTLEKVKERLLQLGTPRGTHVSEEVYLVSAASDECNVKIRNGIIDIKRLITVEDELERWKPVFKAGFPLQSSAIISEVFPDLNLRPPPLAKAEYDKTELLNLIRSQPQLAIVPVSKNRLQFTLEKCQAEFTSTTINRIPRDTVAVEGSDPESVRRIILQIGISDAVNISYTRQIKRVLGWKRD